MHEQILKDMEKELERRCVRCREVFEGYIGFSMEGKDKVGVERAYSFLDIAMLSFKSYSYKYLEYKDFMGFM